MVPSSRAWIGCQRHVRVLRDRDAGRTDNPAEQEERWTNGAKINPDYSAVEQLARKGRAVSVLGEEKNLHRGVVVRRYGHIEEKRTARLQRTRPEMDPLPRPAEQEGID